MNPPMRRRCSMTLCLALLVTVSLPAATPVIGTQLFQETDARIEDLFQYRINPPRPPTAPDNPFRVGDAVFAATADAATNAPPVPAPGTSDEAVLRQAANTLVFGGLLQVGDVQVLVINKASYKQGGILGVRVQGNLVYLRLVSITANSVTLGLNEARLTLRF